MLLELNNFQLIKLTTLTDHHSQITAPDADHEKEYHADHAEQLPNEVGDIQADQTCQIR